jgi:rubrerythrin
VSDKEITRTYSCDDCFNSWESEEEETVCPVCGSWNIFEEND